MSDSGTYYIETLEIEKRKLSRKSNGHNYSHECSIRGHNSSRRSKLNKGSSRQIRMVITFHSNVRVGDIIYRDARNIMSPNRTSEWKVMTIRISRELALLNFERLDILCPRIGHPCENLWPLKFAESFLCSISSVSIYYFPESGIRVKR